MYGITDQGAITCRFGPLHWDAGLMAEQPLRSRPCAALVSSQLLAVSTSKNLFFFFVKSLLITLLDTVSARKGPYAQPPRPCSCHLRQWAAEKLGGHLHGALPVLWEALLLEVLAIAKPQQSPLSQPKQWPLWHRSWRPDFVACGGADACRRSANLNIPVGKLLTFIHRSFQLVHRMV